jgi:hypothetical protein
MMEMGSADLQVESAPEEGRGAGGDEREDERDPHQSGEMVGQQDAAKIVWARIVHGVMPAWMNSCWKGRVPLEASVGEGETLNAGQWPHPAVHRARSVER